MFKLLFVTCSLKLLDSYYHPYILTVEILCIWGSISCALAPKFCGGTRVHLIYKTQKRILEISSGLGDIKLINYFNVFPKLKLRELK